MPGGRAVEPVLLVQAPTSQPDVSAAVMARLGRYTPSCLPADDWTLGAPAVRAAVLGVGPSGPEDAKGLASRLCLFLAGPCGWHRRCAPDLEQLLSRAAIDAHLARLAAADTGEARLERADLCSTTTSRSCTTWRRAGRWRSRRRPPRSAPDGSRTRTPSELTLGDGSAEAEEVEGEGILRELPGKLGLGRPETVCEKGGSCERAASRCLRPALTSLNDRAAEW